VSWAYEITRIEAIDQWLVLLFVYLITDRRTCRNTLMAIGRPLGQREPPLHRISLPRAYNYPHLSYLIFHLGIFSSLGFARSVAMRDSNCIDRI
jgi:hypothetical protein